MNALATIAPEDAAPAAQAEPMVFSFGDPESVLDRRELAQYFEIWHNGRWYEPPLPLGRLAQVFNASPYHRAAVGLKINMLVSQMIESRWLDGANFERFALDFVQMGNGYLEWLPNLAGRLAQLAFAPALHVRVGIDAGAFWFVNGPIGQAHPFTKGSIFHLQQPDVAQEIYGVPEWLSALQSALLSENATLFRRRYYLNGAHAGFVFYVSEPLADQATIDQMTEKLQGAKGVGNFKNMFVNIPKGKKDGIQIMPIGDVAAKDEFHSVKTISRDDMLAAHRQPPQLLGIVPNNGAAFGNVVDARDAYFETEIVPIQRRMLRMNAWSGLTVLAFRDYLCSNGDIIQQDGTRIRAGVK